MKHPAFYILMLAIVLAVSCKKKKDAEYVEPEPLPEVKITDDRPACDKLPEAPKPLGWRDSIFDQNTNVNAFIPNPLNADEVLCVVNGDMFGFNKLLVKNVVTKSEKVLAILGDYLPQVNKEGWVTYSDVNNNVFIVKTNGDSLKQLTFDKLSLDPKWDYTNRSIYYLRDGFGNFPPQLYKINLDGSIAAIYYGEFPHTAPFRNSNKYVYLKSGGSTSFCTLMLKTLDSAIVLEKDLITGPMFDKKGRIFFEDLTLDHKDENLYWSNSEGIFKCNLNTRKIDTVFRNCENSVYSNIMTSVRQNEMTYTLKHIKPINTYILLHDYLPMELDLQNKSSRLVRIFPR